MDVVRMKARMKAVLPSTWFPLRKEVVLRGKEGSIAAERCAEIDLPRVKVPLLPQAKGLRGKVLPEVGIFAAKRGINQVIYWLLLDCKFGLWRLRRFFGGGCAMVGSKCNFTTLPTL